MTSLSAAAPPVVLADVWEGGSLRPLVLVAGGAALTGVAAQVTVPLPGTPVPFTLQTFAVLLVGTALGPALGAASMMVYMLLGLVGVPWFAGQGSGFHAPTFGYLVGFVAAAWACGLLSKRGADRTFAGTLALMGLGSLVIYACGVPVLAWSLGISLAAAIPLGLTPFLAGDVIKALVAAAALPGTWRLIGSRHDSV